MRVHRKILLGSLFVVSAVTGCSERALRPLVPCTTAGVSQSVQIQDITDVDMLFMIDNSGSMREEQKKLRDQFPLMINALVTGDINGDNVVDGPSVKSLRVAVVTSDMGLLGVGTGATTGVDAEPLYASCNAMPNPSMPSQLIPDVQQAFYGEDGVMRRQMVTLLSDPFNPASTPLIDCDVDGTPGDDSVTAAGLPTYLTFPGTNGGDPALTNDAAGLLEYGRRIQCFSNVGTSGCEYEQQLEAVLKAVTPAGESDSLVGGAFHSMAAGDAGSRGHGDDPLTNGGWFRDPTTTLLALIVMTDEEDCSAADPRVFNSHYNGDPAYTDPLATRDALRRTRCWRFGDLLQPVDRYVQGLTKRRELNPRLLVFAAITGVPPELTDDGTTGEGALNLDAILAHPRMQYTTVPRLTSSFGNLGVDLYPACAHRAPEDVFTVTGDTTMGSSVLTNVTVASQPTPAPSAINITGNLVALNNNRDQIQNVSVPGVTLKPGMAVSGPGIPAGTLAFYAQQASDGRWVITLSQELDAAYQTCTGATPPAQCTGAALTINSSVGPARDMYVTGAGIADSATVVDVTGAGPYTVTLAYPATATATGVTISLGNPDVLADPPRRLVEVVKGMHDLTGLEANHLVQSICVDDFRPAISRILETIQSNLAGSCLPRPLIRNALNQVSCDVFVTMPPNVACDSKAGYELQKTVPARLPTTDTDGLLERCRVQQVPVTPIDVASGNAPNGVGWFYDTYTADVDVCGGTASALQRISFAGNADPPQGATMQFGCAQPVQDGELAVDINAGCNNSNVAEDTCLFPTQAAAADFVLRYNLPDTFQANIRTGATAGGDFVCETDSRTCQIRCDTDADCPGGFVCYDDPNDAPLSTDRTTQICVNPTCGSGD